MLQRKKQSYISQTIKADYIAEQTPKMPNNLDSVDDILDSVDNFIEGVYRDLSITPPQRLSFNATCSRSTSRRSPNIFDSSSSSSTSLVSPMGATGSTLSPNHSVSNDRSVSPTSHRNIDADIERINRICDNVDKNLRSIGVFTNNSHDNKRTTKCEQNENRQPDTSIMMATSTPSVIDVTTVSSPIGTTTPETDSRQRGAKPNPIADTVSHVIDLSEYTPEVLRPAYRLNNDDDDDVIIVSANISPVVDLCTPYLEEQSSRRPNIIQSQLGRRRLAEPEYDIEQHCYPDQDGPSVARRRRTRNSGEFKASIKTIATDTPDIIHKADNIPKPTTTSAHTPFMCPVCMDSCLQRQPTSTKCGHVFCEVCIKRAIRLTHKCPMCNTKISNTQIFRIYL